MRRLIALIVSGILFYFSGALLAGEHYTKKDIIEVPCQGGKLWVYVVSTEFSPKTFVKFTSSWDSTGSFVLVDDTHAPSIDRVKWDRHDLYSGSFYVNKSAKSFTIDGCYVAWGDEL